MSANSYRFWPWALAGLMLLIAAGALYRLGTAAPADLDPRRFYDQWRFALAADPRLVVSQPLTDQDGQAFPAGQLLDHWSFVYFGYTNCPDICVPTLQRMQRVADSLGQAGGGGKWLPLRWIMVSVDPQRDTPARLRAYLQRVAPSVLGLTAPPPVLNPLALQFDVSYAKEPVLPAGQDGGAEDDPHRMHRAGLPQGLSDEVYNVGHSGDIFLLDPQGRLRGRFPPPQTPEQVRGAFLAVQRAYAKGAGTGAG